MLFILAIILALPIAVWAITTAKACEAEMEAVNENNL